jgi:thiosulfate/3-mercaptopyruvate sulfurtransferase
VRYQFVDCRWSLTDPEWGRRAYLDGHIPGATHLDVDRHLAAAPGPNGRHPLPSAEAFAHAAGEAGIGAGIFVVAYGTLGGAERLWWLLRHFGHGDCAIVDFDSWHGPLERGELRILPARFHPEERAGDVIELDELRTRLDELVVVDSRKPNRFRGEENDLDRVPGRIPGALNAPWDEPVPELPPGELVSYCGSGITSCVTLHRLHLAGREGRLYPGSWSEWEQHPGLPVARG